jgi:beta-galactosidase/beta-glucuronidase
MTLPRPEYPRPQLVRETWLNLNGTWRFAFDDENRGLHEKWFAKLPSSREILVPFAFQSPLSGIGSNDFHDVVWYERAFALPESWSSQRVLLHFGAVDYRATVWVNGIFATSHEGGHTPFSTDITALIGAGENRIVVRVEDLSEDLHQPRGKQYWQRDSAAIFYTRTTGIWQTVWLEAVGQTYISNLSITPDIDARVVRLDYELAGDLSAPTELIAAVRFNDQAVTQALQPVEVSARHVSQVIALGEQIALWSPETPNLYDLRIEFRRGEDLLDVLSAYFGMRKISIENGRLCLNNQPYTMRLVLDQGYHPQGILTFPTDADYQEDIRLTKALGFNGARKHQKVEDPRYLYWADRMGLLVWGEMANAYAYSPEYVQRITSEWQQVIRRDYNHPCIVAWVPMNESWGVPDLQGSAHQREHLTSLYHLTRSLDNTRLVVSNDGWEHAQTDLLTIHDYESDGAVLLARYASLESTLEARPAKRDLFVPGYQYAGQPVLLTEYGGIGYRKSDQEGWGYSVAQDEADFLRRFAEIVEAVYASPVLQGFCYTQLTDVEQEINGLLTYDRQPKADLDALARINRGERAQSTG